MSNLINLALVGGGTFLVYKLFQQYETMKKDPPPGGPPVAPPKNPVTTGPNPAPLPTSPPSKMPDPSPISKYPVAPAIVGAYVCPLIPDRYIVPNQYWMGASSDIVVSAERMSPYDDKATPLVSNGINYWVRQRVSPEYLATCGKK